jgi:hypothetical protein
MGQSEEGGATWDFAKPGQRTRWPYTKWYNAHIKKRIRYAFVRQGWDREIAELQTQERLKAEPHDPGAVRLSDEDRDTLCQVEMAGVGTLLEFLDWVCTQASAERFCETAEISPERLMALLDKLRKYLPFGTQMRQLVDKEDAEFQEYVDRLVAQRLGHSLALLEVGRTREGRAQLARETGIPEDAVLDLVRRADLTRLRLMAGGMVRQTWAMGYRGLAALQRTTPEEYYERCASYYAQTAKGMPFDLTRQGVVSHLARMRDAVTLVEE